VGIPSKKRRTVEKWANKSIQRTRIKPRAADFKHYVNKIDKGYAMSWWQHIPESINPNIFDIGFFQVRYYGLMYVIAFATIYWLVLYRIKKQEYDFSRETLHNYFVWAILGVMIGGRLGYVLFYNFPYFLEHPLEIISPFHLSNEGVVYTGISGMSYHGGLIGVVLMTLLFCQKNKINVLKLADLLSPAVPLGYTFGRMGNFINGELYGRATSVPWGMYFPLDPTHQLRHPSQLYEAFFEGILLFIILWRLKERKLFDGFLFCLYLIGYGVVRFFIEFVREPDSQMGFIFCYFTMGQILCIFMVSIGIAIIIVKKQHITNKDRS
jgi:phosphatidylglycerol:prolipoprotein diacylglycerol transferase